MADPNLIIRRGVPAGLVVKPNCEPSTLAFTKIRCHYARNRRNALRHSTLFSHSARPAVTMENFCHPIPELRAIVRKLAHHFADDAIGMAFGWRSYGLDQGHFGNISCMLCPALRSNIFSISSSV